MTDARSRCSLCNGESTWVSPTGHAFCDNCRKEHSSPGTVLAGLLDNVEAHLNRFVVFPNRHCAVAVALWIGATHIIETLDVAPYLLVTAPEIESGKTRLIEVTAPLVAKPMFSASISPAVLFRIVDAEQPTLFLDEADAIWSKHGDEKNLELVALLNAGHRRGMKARRMGGPGKTTVEEFDVFSAKCIAGAFPDVSRIPEALRSRSIHLRMQRKFPRESVTRWTRKTREVWEPQLAELRDELAALLDAVHPVDVDIDPPDELGDRDHDVWEPLLQIASRAGQQWLQAGLDAAIALCAPDATQTIPYRLLVLRDIAEIWDGSPFMFTKEILDALYGLEERRWHDFYGTPLTPHKLAKYLSAYDVESKPEPGEARRRGYYLDDLNELFVRYGSGSVQSVQSVQEDTETAGPESFESIESFPGVDTPGVNAGNWCRCGKQLDHYTKTGFPYCDDCGPPEDWEVEVLSLFTASEGGDSE